VLITADFHENRGGMLQTRPKEVTHPTGIILQKLSGETSLLCFAEL
jgi:hypothetical protein